ncbi:hypothetical protein Csa_023809, partial [Cucumis sativus]
MAEKKMMKSHSHRHKLSSKCAALIKQQRGRIYLLRRCATILLCSYIHGDHD